MESNIINGDCLEVLKTLPERIADMCVTSPPYYGLRDYGEEKQIGREETPEEYIDRLVKAFREVRRVLRDDGTLWVNIGDSYAGKSLLGIPWLLAFALKNDGWYLRQDIIWHKPNPMPESAKDRCTKSHEYIFLFSKRPHYYFNYRAIQEEAKTHKISENHIKKKSKYSNSLQESSVRQGMHRDRGNKIIAVRKKLPSQERFVTFIREHTTVDFLAENTHLQRSKIEHWFRKDETGFSFPSIEDWKLIRDLIDDWSEEFRDIDERMTDVTYETDAVMKNFEGKRNKRDVWSIPTKALKEAHFAVYPEELISPCIKAGSRPQGIVLDPFFGSGTTGVVAQELNRKFIGIELNDKYVEIAKKRTSNVQMILQEGSAE